MDTQGEPTSPDRRSRPGHRLPRRLGILSLATLVAVAVAIAVGIGTQLTLAHTEASLDTTRTTLQRAEVRLDAVRDQLAAAKVQSTAAGITLAGESSELAKDEAALARAQIDVVANGVNISALDACLSGVEQTLNQIAVGDIGGASSTLGAVEGTCKAALPAGS
jgi:hypothetical protein